MPSRDTKTSKKDYCESLDELTVIYEKYMRSHEIVIAGGMNAETEGKDDDLSRLLMQFCCKYDFVLPFNWPDAPTYF